MAELVTLPLVNDASLKAYWKLENVNDSKDSFTLGIAGAVAFVPGIFHNCADFGATNTNKRLARNSNLGINGTGSISISLWAKMRGWVSGNDYLFVHYSTGGADRYIGIVFTSTTVGIDTGNLFHNYTFSLGTTTWHHLCVTRNGTTNCNLYIDGTKVLANQSLGLNTGSRNNVTIGSSDVPADFAAAYVDDVSVFSRVLTDSEVSMIYQGLAGGFILNFI